MAKHYVYVLRSISHPDQFYTGLCSNVEARVEAHNSGQSPHSSKYKPWKILTYQWFEDERSAAAFERYLKSGSGRAFSAKRFRP
jgi:predicted GIY-YIG superfamily endonuclease